MIKNNESIDKKDTRVLIKNNTWVLIKNSARVLIKNDTKVLIENNTDAEETISFFNIRVTLEPKLISQKNKSLNKSPLQPPIKIKGIIATRLVEVDATSAELISPVAW